MTSIVQFIPNFITLLNAFCGAIAILLFANDLLVAGSFFILAGALFDFFDGLVARALKTSSAIGKDLDSLADVITFGLAPAFLAHKLLLISLGAFATDFNPYLYLQYLPFVIVMFTAWRLAKFNHDTRQSSCFFGLASPAHAMLWISIPLMIHFSDRYGLFNWVFQNFHFDISVFIFQPQLIIGLVIILSTLMIVDLPLFAMKFDQLTWKRNELKFGFLFISLFLIVSLGFIAAPLILLLYIILSLIHYKILYPDEIQS